MTTRQNNVRIFGTRCRLWQNDKRTNRQKDINTKESKHLAECHSWRSQLKRLIPPSQRWSLEINTLIKKIMMFSLVILIICSSLRLCPPFDFQNSIFAREARELFTYDLQQWHSAKCFLHFVFYICLSVCGFVKGNVCRKFTYCFVYSIWKKRSFFTLLCVLICFLEL